LQFPRGPFSDNNDCKDMSLNSKDDRDRRQRAGPEPPDRQALVREFICNDLGRRLPPGRISKFQNSAVAKRFVGD
jgi:hypothetical protein